jgi:RNA polymerase sigma-70 factor (ECF subfamily)
MSATDNSAGNTPTGRLNATSNTLLIKIKDGDPVAWSRLVRLYAPLVLWWCRQRGFHQQAEDIAQDVFACVFEKVGTFTKYERPGAFRCWLRNITRNKLHEHGRKERKQVPGGPSIEDVPDKSLNDDDDPPAPSERCLLVRRALESIRGEFQPQTWEVAWQVLVEGRWAPDVARDFDIQVGTVYTAKSRVLRRLREEYEGLLT